MTDEPKWKLLEKVVSILEKALSPESKVEHNINLPVLDSESGRTRQCDVVVTSGSSQRPTVSIIEVQSRNTKPSIGDFSGWCDKMKEVGAQHLICVSKIGFPLSIIEKARQIGPTVILMTLEELESNSWPIIFLENSIYTNRRKLISAENVVIDFKYKNEIKEEITVASKEKAFRLGYDRFTYEELVFRYLDMEEFKNGLFSEGFHRIEITYPLDNQPLHWIRGEVEFEVIKFKLIAGIQFSRHKFELKSRVYRQLEQDTTAWIMDAKIELNNVEREVRVVLVPNGGFYNLTFWNLPINQ